MRRIVELNENWRFHLGDLSGAELPGYNDTQWRMLNLPHDWSIEGPFDSRWASATGYLPGGIGWYRKDFQLPDLETEDRVYIDFDGVYCNSDVWINGKHVGYRPNGFLSFQYDLTPHILFGATNVLAVRVNHEKYADCRWYTGSGINREVRLVVLHPVHIKHWGVFVSSKIMENGDALVKADVELENMTNRPQLVNIHCALVSSEGLDVARDDSEIEIAAKSEDRISFGLIVKAPQLWSMDSPCLYTLRTQVCVGDRIFDRMDTVCGIRSVRFDPEEGLTINGESVKMRGVCIHDDAGTLGTAVPEKVWRRRLSILRDAGVNAIRMSHNPHAPELYDLFDQMGFLVQDEAFDEWELGKHKWIQGWNVGVPGTDGYHEYFKDWAERDIRDMILRDRNHPSIIMWSIGNEIDYPNDPYTHEILDVGENPQIYGRGYDPTLPHSNRLGEVAKRLVEIVKRYDNTRPVTAALASALISNETGFADALDIVGYNYQEYRYEEDHKKYPLRPLYGSENGMRWSFWNAVATKSYISGQFLWTGIDYLGEAGRWPNRGSGSGLLDLCGFPKPEYFFRQSIWTEKPMLFLGTCAVPSEERMESLWSHTHAEPKWGGEIGVPIRVICFTNCKEVELFVNDRSLGVKHLNCDDNPILWWDVPYEDGAVKAIGGDGVEIQCFGELRSHSAPCRILCECDVEFLRGDGKDLAQIEVKVVDESGVLAYDADNVIEWIVEGPIRLMGLESGDQKSHEDYRSNKRRVFHGREIGYVQAMKDAGMAKVILRSSGLAPTEIRIPVNESGM